MLKPYLGPVASTRQELSAFLTRVYEGYRQYNVSYHNDLHGFDVCQMTRILLQGPKGLGVRAKLSELDCLAVLVAAVCHDNSHDGFTNLWHKNKDTTRFKEHGLEGTQEKFHFAISWQALTENADCNFIKDLTYEEHYRFKQRMQGCIYATDMGRHVADLKTMKEMLATLKVECERDPIVSEEDQSLDLITQQQKWLELAVHFSDVSF